MTTVMLVDDQEMIRKGLRVIIDAYPGLDVVAEAGDGGVIASKQHSRSAGV
ncbi:hypothetical protein ACI3QN_12135 [Propionibacterium freudenreichii]|uniref:hypothetical protein n=1 Tax=Propionibacterium freudenreichii TaxID=1744 RepID=UPI003854A024